MIKAIKCMSANQNKWRFPEMKKKDFVTLIMSTVGGILFALGMCMTLLPRVLMPAPTI